MGLAASQCRLLFITSRQNDVSAKMQRISNDRLVLSRDEDDIDTKYNRMLSATKYQNVDGTDISYNAIMGSAAAQNGQCNIITNAYNQVVLSTALANKFGLTAESGNGTDFKRIIPDVQTLVRNAEGADSPVLDKLSSATGKTQVEEATWVGHWRYACEHDDNIRNLGSYNFNKDMTYQELYTKLGSKGAFWLSGRADAGNYLAGYFSEDMLVNNDRDGVTAGMSRNDNTLTINDFSKLAESNGVVCLDITDGNAGNSAEIIIKQLADHITEKTGLKAKQKVGNLINNVKTLIDSSKNDNNDCEDVQGAMHKAMNQAKDGFIGHAGLSKWKSNSVKIDDSNYESIWQKDYFYMNLGEAFRRVLQIMLGGTVDSTNSRHVAEESDDSVGIKVNEKGLTKDEFEKRLKGFYDWYVGSDAELNADNRHFPEGESTMSWKNALTVFQGGSVPKSTTPPAAGTEQASQNLANYYVNLWNNLSTYGWTTQSNETIQANLNQGLYYINGTLISESDSYDPKKDQDTIDAAEHWYEVETKKLKRKEDQMDRDLQKYQTEYSALTNDYNSVKSIIDANVQKSFTYCQNG